MIGLYILAGVLINALPVALDKWPHKAEPEGKSGGFTYGNDETGMVSVQWLEDKASNRPLFVSYLAFAESRSFGSQDREGRISFDSHYVDVPKLKPVRYLFTPPAADESQPNILIVKKDGTVIRIARRVPPDQVDSTINAANGVRDFDELKTRLEALLPAPAIAAR